MRFLKTFAIVATATRVDASPREAHLQPLAVAVPLMTIAAFVFIAVRRRKRDTSTPRS